MPPCPSASPARSATAPTNGGKSSEPAPSVEITAVAVPASVPEREGFRERNGVEAGTRRAEQCEARGLRSETRRELYAGERERHRDRERAQQPGARPADP